MRDAVFNAVAEMTFQNNLAAAVQRRLRGVDLGEDILAGDVLIDHAVDGLNLTDDFLESAVKVVGIHARTHRGFPYDGFGFEDCRPVGADCQSPAGAASHSALHIDVLSCV